jgi:hypothetical protein
MYTIQHIYLFYGWQQSFSKTTLFVITDVYENVLRLNIPVLVAKLSNSLFDTVRHAALFSLLFLAF